MHCSYVPSFRWYKKQTPANGEGLRIPTGSSHSSGDGSAIDITGLEDVAVDVPTPTATGLVSRLSASTSGSTASNASSSSMLKPLEFLLRTKPTPITSATVAPVVSNDGLRRRVATASSRADGTPPPAAAAASNSASSASSSSIRSAASSLNTSASTPSGRRVYTGRSADRIARIKASKAARDEKRKLTSSAASAMGASGSATSSGCGGDDDGRPAQEDLLDEHAEHEYEDDAEESKQQDDGDVSRRPVPSVTTHTTPADAAAASSLFRESSTSNDHDAGWHDGHPHSRRLPGAASPSPAVSSSIASSFRPAPPPSDVSTWLRSLSLAEHIALFEGQDMTDVNLLAGLAARDPGHARSVLREIGVGKVGHREKMMAALIAMGQR